MLTGVQKLQLETNLYNRIVNAFPVVWKDENNLTRKVVKEFIQHLEKTYELQEKGRGEGHD